MCGPRSMPTEPTPHQQTHTAIPDAEEQLRATFEHDAGAALQVADSATSCLVIILDSVEQTSANIEVNDKGTPIGGDVHLLQLFALVLMGARAVRVIRAARAVLACGYEPESRANDRILIELIEHRRAILDDPTGAQAKAWMEGSSGRGIGTRVAERAPEGLYSNLSKDSHGDVRPLAGLLDAETGTIYLQPTRTRGTRASLLMHAGFASDQAVAIAGFAGLTINGIEPLNAAIKAGLDNLDGDTQDDVNAAT
jgi:hypothetical protein